MSRESRIQYNPALSVGEIAKRNGVSVAAVRYYIRVNDIDRRYDRKQNVIEDCRKYLQKHPKATWHEVQKKTGHSLSTIRKYRRYITEETELPNFDSEKAKRRQLRQSNNYYATHPSVTQDLLREEQFHTKILEPFCGGGTMAEIIKQNGYEVEAYDLIDRGYGKVGDFFKVDYPKKEYDIITNPPYDGNLIEIIKRCLSLCKNKVAILLPIRYLSGKERHKELYSKFPPSRVYVYCERVTIAKDADFDKYSSSGANMTIYGWYVWERGHKGETELKWIHNVRQEPETEEEKPKIEEVAILDGIPFKPYQEFQIPVSECIQFHSKALPENKVLSNHFECIITFRGYEFYGLEQMYAALNYSDSPSIVKKIMGCNSGKAAKSLCHKNYADKRDVDFEEKRYRIIVLCHLFKYLSVKEYRDRLRETYPQTLVESPNGQDYHFGMVQNLQTNVFEGNNCSGRTSMLVRDKMIALENETIKKCQNNLGRELTPDEREAAYQELYSQIRERFENDKQVLKDSKPLFTVLAKEGIAKERNPKPKPFKAPTIDRKTKCLVLDFDDTLFDTSADDAYRKCEGKKDMDKAKEMIPQYRLYEGWQDVIDWVKNNGVKIAILSAASSKLIEDAMMHFSVPCAAIIGYQPYIEKPNAILGNMLQERLNVRHEQIIYVGNSKSDETQARASQFRFIGATWSSRDADYFTEQGVQTISNPKELIAIMEDAGWKSPMHPRKFKDEDEAFQYFKGDNEAFLKNLVTVMPDGVTVMAPEEPEEGITEFRYRERTNPRSTKYYGLVRCTKDYAYFYQGVPFSNWWTSPAIEYNGHTFSSSESLFMYLKAMRFGDTETAEKISKSTYSAAKKLGRTVKDFDYSVWCSVREEAMYIALTQKLKYDAEFREALLSDAYKGKTFVEASREDTIWGIGAEATDAVLKQGKTAWRGTNLLGKTLTRLRDIILLNEQTNK